jgi:hypothetical protein
MKYWLKVSRELPNWNRAIRVTADVVRSYLAAELSILSFVPSRRRVR